MHQCPHPDGISRLFIFSLLISAFDYIIGKGRKMNSITFKNPPVNEVIFIIDIDPSFFSAIHYGSLYEIFCSDFPTIQEHPPIQNVNMSSIVDPFTSKDFYPRLWFIGADQSKLIQIQPSKFIFNWRKLKSADEYPRFDHLAPTFIALWERFQSFAQKRSVPQIAKPLRFELTYINHFDESRGWTGPKDNKRLLKFLQPVDVNKFTCAGAESHLFYEQKTTNSTLTLSTKQGSRRPDNTPILLMELNMKHRYIEGESALEWFNSANSTINEIFVELTTLEAHKIWQKV